MLDLIMPFLAGKWLHHNLLYKNSITLPWLRTAGVNGVGSAGGAGSYLGLPQVLHASGQIAWEKQWRMHAHLALASPRCPTPVEYTGSPGHA